MALACETPSARCHSCPAEYRDGLRDLRSALHQETAQKCTPRKVALGGMSALRPYMPPVAELATQNGMYPGAVLALCGA